MAVLYWLRAKSDTDPFTQGYIGVTQNLTRRLRQHKFSFKKLWPSLSVQPLVEAEESYCFTLEKELRPTKNIGLNKACGGYRNNKMVGNENPNFGKFGENAPNFIGWYITPLGRFSRPEDAAKIYECSLTTIARKCKGRYVHGKFIPPQKGFAFEQKA